MIIRYELGSDYIIFILHRLHCRLFNLGAGTDSDSETETPTRPRTNLGKGLAAMTVEEYDNLQVGDIVRHVDERQSWRITERNGDDIIAMPCERWAFVDKSKEWDLISKATPTPKSEGDSSPSIPPSDKAS